MALRIGFLLLLVALYALGAYLASITAPMWVLALLMGVVFIGLVAAMYLRVLPALLALPILAVALASIAGMKWDAIFTTVVQEGSIRLSTWIIAAIMGSILAQVVEKTGIAQTAIKKTAELGGDRPMILAVLLTIVIALLFTTLGGLGAVIMVATIVLPILLSLGLRPLYVGCLFLLAMSMGGAFNLVNWQAYKDTLGMTSAQIGFFALPFAGLMLVTTFAFMFIEGKRLGKARYKATVMEQEEAAHPFVPWYALLTPVIPLLPVLFFALLPKVNPSIPTYDFPITVALLLGILYGAVTTWRKGQSTVQMVTKSAFDGVAAVGPALVLMIGIGMVLKATMSPEVSKVIQPILTAVVPHGSSLGAMIGYVALFTVLAPMALYRGPLNLYGMGAGLIGALQGLMPSGAIMGAFMSVGMIQGVSDPTNTHNVWIANYTNTDVQDILKRTLPYMWILALVGLILSAVLYYGGVVK
ncbi:MAG: transporter [Armatimonadota bacterium]